MTREKYNNYCSNVYRGKHEQKDYLVYRVLSAGGPEQRIQVQGFDNAKAAIAGCWDWEVTRLEDGKVVL